MRERLNVYYCGQRAGVLEYDDYNHCFIFTYDGDYLSSDDAMPLSLSLPLKEEPAGVLERISARPCGTNPKRSTSSRADHRW